MKKLSIIIEVITQLVEKVFSMKSANRRHSTNTLFTEIRNPLLKSLPWLPRSACKRVVRRRSIEWNRDEPSLSLARWTSSSTRPPLADSRATSRRPVSRNRQRRRQKETSDIVPEWGHTRAGPRCRSAPSSSGCRSRTWWISPHCEKAEKCFTKLQNCSDN